MNDKALDAGSDPETFKRRAAEAAFQEVREGMRLGLGTGSTARHIVEIVAAHVKKGFNCVCVSTSEQTSELARSLGMEIAELDAVGHLDLTIDGADEIDPLCNLIKGGGGALLREKIVAAASDRMIVIADQSKLVPVLGQYPLPIEINRFGEGVTMAAVVETARRHGADGRVELRRDKAGMVFETDGGHHIADAFFGRISDAEALSNDLFAIPGVVEHGLFVGMCTVAYIAGPDGVKRLEPQR